MKISKIKIPGVLNPIDIKDTTYQFEQVGDTLNMGVDGGAKSVIYQPTHEDTNKVIAAAINEVALNIKSTTWNELITLKYTNNLVPGMWYKITDWEPVTAQEKTISDGNGFDILVFATSKNTLSECAKASKRPVSGGTYYLWNKYEQEELVPYNALTEELYQPGDVDTDNPARLIPLNEDGEEYGHDEDVFVEIVEEDGNLKAYKTDPDVYPDEVDYEDYFIYSGETIDVDVVDYFADINLGSWLIFYSINNDTNRFPWADINNSKGVVYKVITENGINLIDSKAGITIEKGGKKKDVLKLIGLGRYKMVDLGLPSGIMWADCNVGAENPEDEGLYFSWGSVEGATANSGRSFDGFYNSEKDWRGTYGKEHGSQLGDSDNIPVGEYFDASRKYCGGAWRMPTKDEFLELHDECTWTWTTRNGVDGYEVEGSNGNSIFLPAAGYYDGTSLYSIEPKGLYWSSSCYDESGAYSLSFDSGNVSPLGYYSRYHGLTVRPVSDAVDLGLPSGRLWANKNLGADSITDNGLYYSWGNIEGHEGDEGYNFDDTTYEGTKGYTFDTDLHNNTSCDAAKAALGGDWHMPSKEDFQELYDYCTWTWTDVDGTNGYEVVSKINGASIFFPASGDCSGTSQNYVGSDGSYWSTSYYNEDNAYYLGFNSGYVNPLYDDGRYVGFTVRPVQ